MEFGISMNTEYLQELVHAGEFQTFIQRVTEHACGFNKRLINNANLITPSFCKVLGFKLGMDPVSI